jgi:hypothetical protein
MRFHVTQAPRPGEKMSEPKQREWWPIEMAPTNGEEIEVGWLPNGQLEHGPIRTYWHNGQWNGGWTPTHFRYLRTLEEGK